MRDYLVKKIDEEIVSRGQDWIEGVFVIILTSVSLLLAAGFGIYIGIRYAWWVGALSATGVFTIVFVIGCFTWSSINIAGLWYKFRGDYIKQKGYWD